MRNDVRDMWIGSLLLTLAISLPIMFASDDPVVQFVLTIVADLIIVWYFGTRLAKAGVFDKENQEINKKHLFILLPICISFMALPISCLIAPDSIVVIENEYLWLYIIQDVLIAISEEMFFRIIVYRRLRIENRLLKIVASAGIFAAFSLISFFSTFSIISTLVDVVVSFILGLLCGFIIEYTHSIYPCMIFHFLSSFVGGTLLSVIAVASDVYVVLYFALPIAALIYLAIVYVFYFIKREDLNNVF